MALADGPYFSILPNPFFHSGTNLKVLVSSQESIPLRLTALHPNPNPHYTTVARGDAFSFFIPPNPFFPIKELAAQPGIEPYPLDFEQHSLDHYKTVAMNERP